MLVSGQVQEFSLYVSQGTYTSAALPSGVTAGNLVYVVVGYYSSVARTCTASMNGTALTQVGSGFHDATVGFGLRQFVYENTPTIAQGNTTVVVTSWSNNPLGCGIHVQERSGLRTSGAVDGTAYLGLAVPSPGTATDAIDLGDLTTSGAAEIVSVCQNSTGTGGPPTAGTNYTSLQAGWDYSEGTGTNAMRAVDRSVGSSGTYPVTFTALSADSGATFHGCAIAFLPPSGGGGSGSLVSRDRRMGGGMGPLLSGGMSG